MTFVSKITKAVAGIALATGLSTAVDAAQRIERVVSPGGIEAWLVRDASAPLLSVEFSFKGGTAQDPAGREGLTNLLAGMMDEGAGELDSQAFQARMQRLNMTLGFGASRDYLSGSLRTLSVNRDASFDMLRRALVEPRHAQADLDRVRQSIAAGLRREDSDPNTLAARAFQEIAFANHVYSRRSRGTLETVGAITPEDLHAQHRRLIARDTLQIAVVGDIDAPTLARLLDETFGGIGARSGRVAVAGAPLQGLGARRVVPLDTPQTIVQFGMPGLRRDDPDFIPAFVMNHVLGGGSFTSRLWQEVREKRGLTYSIGTGLSTSEGSAILFGQTSTRNDRAAQALETIETELRRMAAEGPTEEELAKAKAFLIGSYLLRFDTSARIAQQLLAIQQDNLGIDWIDRRNGVIAAVTIEDVRRTARRLLTSPMLVTLVGRPVGIESRGPGG